MSDDLRAAVAVALLLFAGLLVLVTTGAIVVPPRAATSLRVRRWRWAPVTLLVVATTSAVLLPWWSSRLLCVTAAALGGAALCARPRVASVPRSRSRSSPRRLHSTAERDTREALRMALVLASLVMLGIGVAAAVATTQIPLSS